MSESVIDFTGEISAPDLDLHEWASLWDLVEYARLAYSRQRGDWPDGYAAVREKIASALDCEVEWQAFDGKELLASSMSRPNTLDEAIAVFESQKCDSYRMTPHERHLAKNWFRLVANPDY